MRPLPIIAVLVALSFVMPVGYAISYNGTATLGDGDAVAETLSVGTYSLADGVYSPSPVGISPVTVTKNNNGTYTLNESGTQISSGFYIGIFGDCETCQVECDTGLVSDIPSATVSVAIDGRTAYPLTLTVGSYYPLTMTVSASYTGNSYPVLDVSPVITVSSLSEGNCHQVSTTALRLKVTNASSVVEIIENSNEELVDAGGYDVSTNTSVNHGNNYPAVNLANDSNTNGGISDNSGQIDMSLVIPKGYSFVIYLRTTGNNTFSLTMMKGSEEVISGTVTFNSGFGATGYYLSSVSYDGSSSGYFYSSINNVNRYNAWMSGDTEDYSIIITTEDGQSASRTLKMDLVFQKG